MGRNQAIGYSYHKNIDNCVIISINEPSGNPARFDRQNPKIKAVLTLYFDDIRENIEGYVPMNDTDAQKIKQFVDTYKDKISAIIVHCHAGISRSSAVACIISKYLNGSDLDIWSNHSYIPNELCYKVTGKAFGYDINDEDIEKLKDISENAMKEYYKTEEGRKIKNILDKMIKE